jgi:hypothetical protein
VHLDSLPVDFERPQTLEHDVDLVVVVGLLTVRFGCDQDVDAELEPRRLVNDFVAATSPSLARRISTVCALEIISSSRA